MLRMLLLAAILAQSGRPASAQQLIGLELFDGEIYSIDLHSGQATQVATTSVNKHLWRWHSLARDSSNRLFASYLDGFSFSSTEIYEIDSLTGLCTLVATIPLKMVVGLAFGPGDVLYAINDSTAGASGALFDLHTIDLLTGTTTLIGSTGFRNLATLTYGQGTLWSYGGSGVGLLKIDPVTGLGTDVHLGFQGPLDINESICFSDHGVMYQVDLGFWIQDVLTGVPALVGSLQFPGVLGAIEYLPGTASPFTLGTQGLTNGPMGVQVWGATPLGQVVILRAQGGGGPSFVPVGNPCAGTLLDLNGTRAPVALLRANASGYARLGPVMVPASAAGTTRLQALDFVTCVTSNPARVVY